MKTNKKQTKRSKQLTRVSFRNSPRAGTANMPPDNSGMVQVPRPIVVRNMILKRTFKYPVTIATTATSSANFAFSMYFPFRYISNGSVNFNPPADYTNTLNAFGVYKVKRVQAILQPLITSATVPYPFITAMSLEGVPAAGSPSYAALSSYTSAQQISPTVPTEFSFVVPPIASVQGTTDVQVYKGGWIPASSYNATGSAGYVILAQNDQPPYASNTSYSQATIVYEVWFKNPQ